MFEFLETYQGTSSNVDFSKFLYIILKNHFLTFFLIPLNTPIKIDCILSLGKSNKIENNFYTLIELTNTTLIYQEKKSFLYKSFYMRICNCSKLNAQHENVTVEVNRLGNFNQKKKESSKCSLCFMNEYEEVINKRQFKNFYILRFTFPKSIDWSNVRDEYTTIEVLFQDINDDTDNIDDTNNTEDDIDTNKFEIGKKYNLIVVAIPNEVNKHNVKGGCLSSLWLLNYNKICNVQDTSKHKEFMISTLTTNISTLIPTECFKSLLNLPNVDDMNVILTDILRMPRRNSCLNKICRITKLALILICISNNFLKYLNLHTFAYDIYKKVNQQNKWNNPLMIDNIHIKLRPPHCFFICLDEVLIIEMIKFCNYFCNIKLLNLQKESLYILLTQKYDILVINISNLNNTQINTLAEIMKNGVFKHKDCSFPITTTFWIFAIKSSIRNEQDFHTYINENLLARFDFLFELGFEKDEDLINEILDATNNISNDNKFDYYFHLNNKYSYLKKSTFSNFHFTEISEMPKCIIQKYFSMASDLSTLTIFHIAISELLCISVSILMGKKECLIEHVVLGLFLYDKFVSSTKNKLTQFDKNILQNVINPKGGKITSFHKLMNYFSSYLNATIDL